MAKKKRAEDEPAESQFRFGIGEWYGESFAKMNKGQRSAAAARTASPCPFLSTEAEEAKCWKRGGVCSLRLYEQKPTGEVATVTGVKGRLRTTCPSRFEDGRVIYPWIGEKLLGCKEPEVIEQISYLTRIASGLEEQDETKDDVGRIDKVLVVPASDPMEWCALELQAVYFSGDKMGEDKVALVRHLDETIPFPAGKRRPDYRSSGPKRLMPQLQIKVPSLRRWGKKMAVVVDEDFIRAMGPFPQQVEDVSNCDIAWFVVGFDESGPKARLVPTDRIILTTLESSVDALTAGKPVAKSVFEGQIRLTGSRVGNATLASGAA